MLQPVALKHYMVAWLDPATPGERRLRLDQLMLAVSSFRRAESGLALGMLGVGLAALQWASPSLVCLWLALAGITLWIGHRSMAGIALGAERVGELSDLGARYMAVGILMVGILILAAILFWVPGDTQNHLFWLLVLVVSMAIGTVHTASYPPACVLNGGYSLAAAGLCFAEGTASYAVLGVLSLAMAAILAGVAASIYETSTAMLTLRQTAHEMVERQNDLVAKLGRSDRTKSEFLANMSHELRTPLNAVLGFSDVLRQQLFGPLGSAKYAEYADDIHASGSHLLTLINDILDLSKIEAGKFELRETKVDLHRIVEEATRMTARRAAESGVTQVNDVPHGIIIRGDETALRQVALNVATNAIKFTPRGGLVRASTVQMSDGRFALTVQDTGCGIPEQDLELVFENFGQSRHDLAVVDKGTGLGLPIVRSLMRAHGGDAWLESSLGDGTTVYLTLPSERVLEIGVQAAA